MPWFKGDDKFHDQPELVYISDSAVCLFWCAVSWCSSVGTDGFVPAGQVPRLKGGSDETAQELCKSYLGKPAWWSEVAGGFQIRSFLKFNPSSAKVQALRRYEAERKSAQRSSKCPGGTPTGHDKGLTADNAYSANGRNIEGQDEPAHLGSNEKCPAGTTAGTTGGTPTAPVPVPHKREKKEPTVPKKKFIAPTARECADYAKQIGMSWSEAKIFFDFYESKGWKVGKNPMVSWHHAMSGWKTRNDIRPTTSGKNGSARRSASEADLV